METTDTSGELGRDTCSTDEAERLVRGMGLIFSNTFLYGPTHSVTRKAVSDCYSLLSTVMSKCTEVQFALSDDGLQVDGTPLELKNPLMKMFVTQLTGLGLNTFSLTRGMPQEKFEGLMEIMNAKPEELKQLGGFESVATIGGIDNIKIKRISFRQVEEHEAVVDRGTVERAAFADAAAKVANVAEIVAFLGGDATANPDAAARSIQSVASDTQKLADLIMQAADVHNESSKVDDPKAFSSMVLDSLKRAYEGLLKDPSVKTQKGKRTLAKTLLTLEEQILKKMNEVSGGLAEGESQAISDAIEEMNDELKIDSLTDEYVKKKSAVKNSEERILKYLKKRGVDNIDEGDFKDKLKDAGLTADDWDELLLKSGLNAGGRGRGGESEGGADADDVVGVGSAVGHLAALLVRMEDKFAKSRSAAAEAGSGGAVVDAELKNTLREVDQEVSSIVVETEKKIDQIVRKVRADRDSGLNEVKSDGTPPAMSRAKLMELLAEAVQELCQPLAVISCSLDMVRTNILGEINPQQREVLEMAASNSERVTSLINKLMEISGVPKTLRPDSAIQSSLY